jgi:DNA end-binding protein Ku
MWSGAISFGMVNIPVKLYTAQSSKDIHFHQLHDKDGVRIRQKRICPADGEEVSYEHIVKGYEISPDRYVMIDPEELQALDPKATKTIDIDAFVDLSQIDPMYFERSYYLVPDRGAAKAYKLLMRAMQDSGKIAIAKVVIRTKQYLVAVRPVEKALTMSTLFYNDEVVHQHQIDALPEDLEVNERELAVARQLIESLSTDFEPEKYKDEYRERVIELIERKSEGQEIAVQPAAQEPAKVVNLMAALEASLKAAQARQAGGAEKEEKRPARKRKTA